MQSKTKGGIAQCMCDVIVEEHCTQVINKPTGCRNMLKNNKLNELTDMYALFSKVPSTLKNILSEMAPYIEDRGKSIIDDDENKKDPIKFTKTLLQLKAEMDTMVMNCFGNDPKFNQC